MKAMGLPRLDAFRRADLTPELRAAAAITPDDEHRLTAYTELIRLGLPAEMAQALALSGAIGSASEFAALTMEELGRLLQDEPVRRLLPSTFRVDDVALERWTASARPLTADEAAPGRSAVSEADTAALGRDDDVSHADEALVLGAEQVDAVLTALRQTWSRAETTLKGLGRPRAGIDGAAVQGALAGLQRELAETLARIATPAAGEFAAVDESLAVPATDERLEPSGEIHRLQEELTRLQSTLDLLRASASSGSEESSPALATEAGVSARETSERGE